MLFVYKSLNSSPYLRIVVRVFDVPHYYQWRKLERQMQIEVNHPKPTQEWLMINQNFDVNSAALDVGYESVSQFNREYSRFFGNPSLRDVKNLKF